MSKATGSESGAWLRERGLESALLVGFVVILVLIGWAIYGFLPKPLFPEPDVNQFLGQAAYEHVLRQVELGPRPTGSEAGRKTGDYIIAQLQAAGWAVEEQPFVYQGVAARNIIAKAGQGPVAILGAHYDTRLRADKDPDLELQADPVLGANDGASGVAVLLELARALDKDELDYEVWLTFFDAEDNGRLDGGDYIAGSRFMAANLAVRPEMVIVADMIGDADQQIYKERNSSPELLDRIWGIAADLGYDDYFIPEYKWPILDDHMPFLEMGIPAADLIDFDYPYWHTTQDTADKISADSLERVGRVLEFLVEGP
jgi:Zn-dependent M28 family amino/carboxypeptidase